MFGRRRGGAGVPHLLLLQLQSLHQQLAQLNLQFALFAWSGLFCQLVFQQSLQNHEVRVNPRQLLLQLLLRLALGVALCAQAGQPLPLLTLLFRFLAGLGRPRLQRVDFPLEQLLFLMQAFHFPQQLTRLVFFQQRGSGRRLFGGRRASVAVTLQSGTVPCPVFARRLDESEGFPPFQARTVHVRSRRGNVRNG